jgi:ADP-ribosylglycohydrolase
VTEQKVRSVLLGAAIGDALGVPVEFTDHIEIKKKPVIDMIGYGTYNLPPGTFSDDSSLTFCLAEALAKNSRLDTILEETAKNFVEWLDNDYWTATGRVFDVGLTTQEAIFRLKEGVKPELAGATDESSNGNGSLMRISPLVFYVRERPITERFEITKKISSMTHGHIRSVIACFYYIEFLKFLYDGLDKFQIYEQLRNTISEFLVKNDFPKEEILKFNRLLQFDIAELQETEIRSGGYVIETIEASIWCLLTTNSFKAAVLKAVNLGHDTDTTAAVTGALAGLLYGEENIPESWKQKLARYDDILNLSARLALNLDQRI